MYGRYSVKQCTKETTEGRIMFKKYKKADFLSGDIFLPMIQFAIPLLFSTLFQQLYNTIDTLIVGRTLGETALAAIGASSPIYDMLIGFALGFGNGLAIVTARCFGSRDIKVITATTATAMRRCLRIPLLRLLSSAWLSWR